MPGIFVTHHSSHRKWGLLYAFLPGEERQLQRYHGIEPGCEPRWTRDLPPGPSLLHFLSDSDVVSAIEEAGCFDSDPLDSVVGKRQHDNGNLQDEGPGRKRWF